MKKIIILLVIITVGNILIYSQNISVLSLTGTVQVKENENANWIVPTVGQKLTKGYIIFTGFNSSAIIQIENSKVEVKPLTQMSVSELAKSGNTISTDIYLKYGKIKASITTTEEVKNNFQVRSANSTASVRGTEFEFSDQGLTVIKGEVQLINKSGNSIVVQTNEKAKAGKIDLPVPPIKELVAESSAINNINAPPVSSMASSTSSIISSVSLGLANVDTSVVEKKTSSKTTLKLKINLNK